MIDRLGRRIRIQEPTRLRSLAAILAAIALSAFLGARATPGLTAVVALVAGAAPVVTLLTRWPEWGLVALIPISFLVPWQLGTDTSVGLNAPFILIPLLVTLWILRMIVIEKDVRLLRSRVNTPALLFILGTTLALITGSVQWIPSAEGASVQAQLGGWGLYVFSIALFLLVANQIHELRWLRALTWLFLALGAVYAAGALLQLAIPSFDMIKNPFVEGSVYSPFWTWLVALAFGQFLLNRELKLPWRLLLGLLVAASFILVLSEVARAWISGWLPPLIAIWAIIWLRSWRWGLVVTIVACLVLIPLLPTISAETFATPEQTYSTDIRLEMWPIMVQMIQKSPIVGLGLANYHSYTSLYSVWGYSINFSSHNNFLDIIAQTGLVGFIPFLWLVVEIGWLGWRLRRRILDGFSQAYVYAALGGLAATLASGMAGDWFLPFAYNIGMPGFRSSILVWLFLGGLVVIEQIDRRQPVPDGR